MRCHWKDKKKVTEMGRQIEGKAISVLAFSGALLLLIGTFMHPMGADPNIHHAAFTEYAADSYWVGSHLAQLMGVVFMTCALILLGRGTPGGAASAWIALGRVGAITGLALTGVLQAVDGVALKMMVDHWASAAGAEREVAFHAALAVRFIEIGLASISSLLFGLAVTAYGVGFIGKRSLPVWSGVLAVIAGLLTAISGIAIAFTGFSPLSMNLNMPAGLLLILWMIALSVHCWRLPALVIKD